MDVGLQSVLCVLMGGDQEYWGGVGSGGAVRQEAIALLRG